jgi:hypothetical protein
MLPVSANSPARVSPRLHTPHVQSGALALLSAEDWRPTLHDEIRLIQRGDVGVGLVADLVGGGNRARRAPVGVANVVPVRACLVGVRVAIAWSPARNRERVRSDLGHVPAEIHRPVELRRRQPILKIAVAAKQHRYSQDPGLHRPSEESRRDGGSSFILATAALTLRGAVFLRAPP